MDSTHKSTSVNLAPNEAKFRRYIDHSPDGVFVTDKNERFVEVNPAATRITGYSEAELLEMSVADLFFAEFVVVGRDHFRALVEGGASFSESKFFRKDGAVRWWSIDSIKISSGEYLSFVRDITERKSAELELIETRELFQSFIRYSPIYSFIKEVMPTESRVLHASDNYELMIGIKGSDMVGKTMAELFPAEFAAKITADDWTVVSQGEVLTEDEDLNDRNYTTIKSPITLGSKTLLVGHTIDITERKRAEEALRESEERFRRMFQHSALGMVLVSPDFYFLQANDAFCKMLGYTESELLEKTFQDVTLPEDRPVGQEFVRRVLAGEIETFQFEKRYVHKNGTPLWGSVSATLIRDTSNKPLHFVTQIQDISERKWAEEEREKLETQLLQAQKMESVGRLAGGVAHDFNNMLGVILGHAEMALMKTQPGHVLCAHLEEICKAAERSANLTRQLLAFARKQTIAPTVLDLNETVAGALKMLQRLIGEDIDLAWMPGADLPPVRLDPSQIDQILANLCVNARDAIAGVGKITIETGNITLDPEYCAHHVGFVSGEYVSLSVSDTGCGMDKDTLAHIFEPFFTTKGVGEGTGLGLSTVYGIVKQNYGFINAYSEPGLGTTFTIYLPRHVVGAAGQTRTEGPTSPLVRGQETILLVEDELAILGVATTMLTNQGYSVLAASTPGEAIRLAREHPGEIHLLLTDVVMPEMNGRDLAKNLLSLYPNLKRLFMSGYTADVIAHRGVLDEGVQFIQKPFSVSALTAKIREVLEG